MGTWRKPEYEWDDPLIDEVLAELTEKLAGFSDEAVSLYILEVLGRINERWPNCVRLRGPKLRLVTVDGESVVD
jgi:hypothetical protein